MYKILSSYITMIVLLLILGIGAAIGTFIENDFGSAVAKDLIYNSFWYSAALLLTTINIIFVSYKTKMYRVKARFLFHISFAIILLGAAMTHFFGTDGLMHIREGESSNIVVVNNERVEIPFSIKLIDFRLKRYPGSKSPSEFSSDVIVIDKKNDEEYKAYIFMNNTLTHGGYKFFQTSYDPDEKGTQLSVNKDPGIELTYIGYFLLFLGLIVNLFDKKSRFQYLVRQVNKSSITSILIPIILLATPSISNAQESSEYSDTYMTEFREQSLEVATAFGALVIQSPNGRMKPIDTQNREVLNKLTGKSSWMGMTANQVILGMVTRPNIWKRINLIKVKTSKLRQKLGVDKDQKHVKFSDFFDSEGNYKLTTEVERAYQLVPSRRGTYERDLIKVDERLNITFMSFRGVLLTIFPLPNSENNQWVDFKTMFAEVDNQELKNATNRLLEDSYNRTFDNTIESINTIKDFQTKFGGSIIPDQNRLNTEIWFNKTYLFIKLFISYLIWGIALLIFSFVTMFKNKAISNKSRIAIVSISAVLLSIHTFGIALRWYIGGFAPITNTYETMIFIAFASVFAGVFFLRKSIMAMSASFMMAGIFIFAAYLGEVDPEITSLVPVLKSYWLSIHVSVITASYGFFGVGAILGFISLILFLLRSEKRQHIDLHIKNISYINEITLSLGLVLLVIGNFLGGIWANESWGRYWGWDPKETWAYISIIVYAIVIHIRLIKKIYSYYLFAILSIVAFFSILMTYFGVNYYLTGLHSYATGDPIPFPVWAYYLIGIILSLFALSYDKRILKK